jgi:hypothetical protein
MDLQPNPKLSTPSPFLSIWTKPRGTIRQIVDTNPKKYVLLLAMLSGIFQALYLASNASLGDNFDLVVVFLLCLIGGPIMGLITLYISSGLYSWMGQKLGGRADAEQVRAAVAWGGLPGNVGSLLCWALLLGAYGSDMFTTYAPRFEIFPQYSFLSFAIASIFAIWSFVVFLKCLGEVHGFSAWRAWGTTILAGFVLAAPFVVLSMCLMVFWLA